MNTKKIIVSTYDLRQKNQTDISSGKSQVATSSTVKITLTSVNGSITFNTTINASNSNRIYTYIIYRENGVWFSNCMQQLISGGTQLGNSATNAFGIISENSNDNQDIVSVNNLIMTANTFVNGLTLYVFGVRA